MCCYELDAIFRINLELKPHEGKSSKNSLLVTFFFKNYNNLALISTKASIKISAYRYQYSEYILLLASML